MKPMAAVLLLLSCFGAAAAAQDMALRPFEADGLAAMTSGHFHECASIYAAATRQHRAEPSPPFVAARCFARAGDLRNAERYITIALDRGYRNCSSLRREPALAAIEGAATRCEANDE